jgi:heme iron utilization protein
MTAARALFEHEQNAVLCSLHAGRDGWPFGSIVPYAVLPSGDPVVFLSDIAEHTKNLQRDPRASVFVADPAARERPQAGARLSMLVRARLAEGEEEVAAEAAYFARFPQAEAMRSAHGFRVWILEVDSIRWIAGFGEMGWIDRAAWSGEADPLVAHAAGIVEHMNIDHADATVAIVVHLTGIQATEAAVTALDREGFDARAVDAEGRTHKVRLPFPAPVRSADDVRKAVIGMVTAARKAHG